MKKRTILESEQGYSFFYVPPQVGGRLQLEGVVIFFFFVLILKSTQGLFLPPPMPCLSLVQCTCSGKITYMLLVFNQIQSKFAK